MSDTRIISPQVSPRRESLQSSHVGIELATHDEIVEDSEIERSRFYEDTSDENDEDEFPLPPQVRALVKPQEATKDIVIIISSDEDEEEADVSLQLSLTRPASIPVGKCTTPIRASDRQSPTVKDRSTTFPRKLESHLPPNAKRKRPRATPSPDAVIVISDNSSSDGEKISRRLTPFKVYCPDSDEDEQVKLTPPNRLPEHDSSHNPSSHTRVLPSLSVNHESSDSDGAILEFMPAPKTPRQLKVKPPEHQNATPGSSRTAVSRSIIPSSVSDFTPGDVLSLPETVPSTPGKSAPKAKPMPKALLDRHNTALGIIKQLNDSVFGGRLPRHESDENRAADSPHTLELIWNNRLLTTAGRTDFHRSRDGVMTIKIELSPKVVDSDDRLRNTVAHEMCHAAAWIIDRDFAAPHGAAFQSWGKSVTEELRDVKVTTTHGYEINFKFNWECLDPNCRKTYGRHSNSININEKGCVCGSRLKPLFETRSRSTKKRKALLAGQSQESPTPLPQDADSRQLAIEPASSSPAPSRVSVEVLASLLDKIVM